MPDTRAAYRMTFFVKIDAAKRVRELGRYVEQ